MIRRLLSLIYGVLVFWAGYALLCNIAFEVAPVDMILQCAEGVEQFYLALIACLVPVLAMILILSRVPLVKRLWANLGCIVCAAAILLFCFIFLGSGLLGSGGAILPNTI